MAAKNHGIHVGPEVNSVDVTVLLHDSKQPLCVDGMVRGAFWMVKPGSVSSEKNLVDSSELGRNPKMRIPP